MKYLILIAALFLGACAQDHGGITSFGFDPKTGEVNYTSGKELGSLHVEIEKKADGLYKATVTAGDVKAFEGQAIQAQRISEQTAVSTAVLQQMLPGILCAAGVVTACVTAVAP